MVKVIPSSANLAPRPLIVNLARYFGGAEVRVIELAMAFTPQGGRVACLAGSPLAKRLNEIELSPLELPGSKADPRMAVHLKAAITEGGFNLVDAHNVQSCFWTIASQAGRKNRPALTATVHSSPKLEHRTHVKQWGYEGVQRLCLPHFDRVITVSRYLQAEIAGWGVATDRISLSPNGVTLNRVGSQAGAAVRRELDLQPDDLVVGSVGRLEPAKGYATLINAIARLSPRWPGLKCVVVGDGRLLAELKEQARELGLAGRVKFTGFRRDVMHLMEAFDIFALPSLTEGIPFALLEACASARPIVASRVGGVPEVIQDRHNGCLITPGDPERLAAVLEELFCDPQTAERMGRQAALDVSRDFSIAHMVDTVCTAYSDAIQLRRGQQ